MPKQPRRKPYSIHTGREVRVRRSDGSEGTVGIVFDPGTAPEGTKVNLDGEDFFRKPHNPACEAPDCPIPKGVAEVWVTSSIADSMALEEKEEMSEPDWRAALEAAILDTDPGVDKVFFVDVEDHPDVIDVPHVILVTASKARLYRLGPNTRRFLAGEIVPETSGSLSLELEAPHPGTAARLNAEADDSEEEG